MCYDANGEAGALMKYLRMIWRVMTLDTRPMDADWRPMEVMEDDEFDRDYEALGYTSGGKSPSIEVGHDRAAGPWMTHEGRGAEPS